MIIIGSLVGLQKSNQHFTVVSYLVRCWSQHPVSRRVVTRSSENRSVSPKSSGKKLEKKKGIPKKPPPSPPKNFRSHCSPVLPDPLNVSLLGPFPVFIATNRHGLGTPARAYQCVS